MKINSFIFASLSAVVLSSCNVSLMSAVKLDDVVAVRKAIASGLQPGELNAAASVAYAKGNTAILDELLKSGAVAAPDSVAHKKLEFQIVLYADCGRKSCECPDDGFTSSTFAQYWASRCTQIEWEKDTSGRIYSERRECESDLFWGDYNVKEVEEINSFDVDNGHMIMVDHYKLEYKRIGMNKGYAIYNHVHNSISRFYGSHTYYELTFKTPTSGTFKSIDIGISYRGGEFWRIGRFWLKDAPQESKE